MCVCLLGWVGVGGGCVDSLQSSSAPGVSRSVYLHNNKLTDTGLPDHMFNGSESLEVLTLSSNGLRVVPNNLPSSLYRLHLKVRSLAPVLPPQSWSPGPDVHIGMVHVLFRATNWRKFRPEPSRTCQTSESCICRTTS